MGTLTATGGSKVTTPSGPPPILPRLDIDEDYFQIPFTHERPYVLRFEAGLLLDLHLRRMTQLSGAVDRALALRLKRLRAGCGYIRRGFSRFADYAKERLGISVRMAQEFVRLGEALERLPMLDAVLKQGQLRNEVSSGPRMARGDRLRRKGLG